MARKRPSRAASGRFKKAVGKSTGHAATRAEDWTVPFLDELRKDGHVTRAVSTVPIPRQTAYGRREADEEFRKAWDEAVKRSKDSRRDRAVEELNERVYRGVPEPVLHQGQAQYTAHLPDGTWCPDDDPRAVRDAAGNVVRIPMVLYRKEFAPLNLLLKSLDGKTFKEHVAVEVDDKRDDDDEMILIPRVGASTPPPAGK